MEARGNAMTDSDKNLFLMFILGVILTVFVLVVFLDVQNAKPNETERWRVWQCLQNHAELVADTLCVRTDTTFRVPEPKR
jgi:hypothetical protein